MVTNYVTDVDIKDKVCRAEHYEYVGVVVTDIYKVTAVNKAKGLYTLHTTTGKEIKIYNDDAIWMIGKIRIKLWNRTAHGNTYWTVV